MYIAANLQRIKILSFVSSLLVNCDILQQVVPNLIFIAHCVPSLVKAYLFPSPLVEYLHLIQDYFPQVLAECSLSATIKIHWLGVTLYTDTLIKSSPWYQEICFRLLALLITSQKKHFTLLICQRASIS